MTDSWTIGPACAAEAADISDLLFRQLAEHDLPADRALVSGAVAGILADERRAFCWPRAAAHRWSASPMWR